MMYMNDQNGQKVFFYEKMLIGLKLIQSVLSK